MVILKEILRKVDFENKKQMTKKHETIPRGQRDILIVKKLTCLINAIKHEYSCNILYKFA